MDVTVVDGQKQAKYNDRPNYEPIRLSGFQDGGLTIKADEQFALNRELSGYVSRNVTVKLSAQEVSEVVAFAIRQQIATIPGLDDLLRWRWPPDFAGITVPCPSCEKPVRSEGNYRYHCMACGAKVKCTLGENHKLNYTWLVPRVESSESAVGPVTPAS